MLHCLDRVIISGTVKQWSYAKGMTSYLYAQEILIFDYTKFVEPLRDAIRQNAQALADKNGIEIEFIIINCKAGERKHELAQQHLPEDPISI